MAVQRQRPLVLIFDSSILALMAELLEEEGYRVLTHLCPPTNWAVIACLQPGLIILDHFGPGQTAGWAFLQLLQRRRDTVSIPVVLCTGAKRQLEALASLRPELNLILCPKPFDITQFVTIVNAALASPYHYYAATQEPLAR